MEARWRWRWRWRGATVWSLWVAGLFWRLWTFSERSFVRSPCVIMGSVGALWLADTLRTSRRNARWIRRRWKSVNDCLSSAWPSDELAASPGCNPASALWQLGRAPAGPATPRWMDVRLCVQQWRLVGDSNVSLPLVPWEESEMHHCEEKQVYVCLWCKVVGQTSRDTEAERGSMSA